MPGPIISSQAGTGKEKLQKFAASIGPGIFIIGYVIGTGSVTTMVAAGAKYGMAMTWALACSCFFTYVLIVNISRLTIASGNTLMYNIRRQFGSFAALFIIVGLMTTVVSSVIGVTAIASDIVHEWSRMFMPAGKGVHPALPAFFLIGLLYFLFYKGRHRFFLRVMSAGVAIMGICFIASLFVTIPDPGEIIRGMVPALPEGDEAPMILAGLVGTTMAAVVLASRTYLVAEKGWTLADMKDENRDAIISLSLTFLLSATIMAAAAGTMFPRGIAVEKAIDMVITLEPIAGRFASTIFVLGIIAAAFSSLFPGYLLGPWLTFDFLGRPRKMDKRFVRIFVLVIASMGFFVPVFKGDPVVIMIASQAVSPLMMPLLIIFVLIMINHRKTVGAYKHPWIWNGGLVLTLLFSLYMSYNAFVAFGNLLG